MKNRLPCNLVVTLYAMILATSCQSVTPTMGLEEARKIAAEFQPAAYQTPPRTINDIRKMIGGLQSVPSDCKQQRVKRQEELEFSQEELRIARSDADHKLAAYFLFYQIDFEIFAGRFDRAVEILQSASLSMPDDLRRERAWLYHKMVEVQAKLCDQGEASQAFANLVRVTIGDSGRTYAKKSLQPSRADSFG